MKVNYENHKNFTVIGLENGAGFRVCLSTLGASLYDVYAPCRDGASKLLTLRPYKEEEYLGCYHGKTIGRTAGRIENAEFDIDGKRARLEKNNCGTDNLHGGKEGFHAKNFAYKVTETAEKTSVIFTYFSADGEGGYFGNVNVKVTYEVYEDRNAFKIIYGAEADCKTLLNLTNHVYWNLNGNLEERVLTHKLYINADRYGKLNERLIVEKILPVNEHMDFSYPHNMGDFAEEEDVQRYTLGYDHPYFFKEDCKGVTACSVYSEASGIKMEMRTTYPCVVLYTDNQANPATEVLKGVYDRKYLALCLECQYHPDGVHQTPEKCGITDKNNPYHEEIEYIFTLEK